MGRVVALLLELPDREQIVLECRFGIGRPAMTFREIGNRMKDSTDPKKGISGPRVRQLQYKALRRIQAQLNA